MRRTRDESGSLAVEFAIIAPAILLIFGLIFAYGRAAGVNGMLEAGTRDAARSATQARSYLEAKAVAESVIKEAMASAPEECRNKITVELSPEDEYLPGNAIVVTARCSYGLSDIGLPGAPGTVTAKSSFTSMMDPYRGVGR